MLGITWLEDIPSQAVISLIKSSKHYKLPIRSCVPVTVVPCLCDSYGPLPASSTDEETPIKQTPSIIVIVTLFHWVHNSPVKMAMVHGSGDRLRQ